MEDSLISRISQINWFSSFGKQKNQLQSELVISNFFDDLRVERLPIHWVSKEALPQFLRSLRLEPNPLWNKLEQIPGELRSAADQTGKMEMIPKVMDEVSEMVFHRSFDGAFRAFGPFGKEIVEMAVGTALYVCCLACLWELVDDQAVKSSANPFASLLAVFAQGYWPLGVHDDSFYVA